MFSITGNTINTPALKPMTILADRYIPRGRLQSWELPSEPSPEAVIAMMDQTVDGIDEDLAGTKILRWFTDSVRRVKFGVSTGPIGRIGETLVLVARSTDASKMTAWCTRFADNTGTPVLMFGLDGVMWAVFMLKDKSAIERDHEAHLEALATQRVDEYDLEGVRQRAPMMTTSQIQHAYGQAVACGQVELVRTWNEIMRARNITPNF